MKPKFLAPLFRALSGLVPALVLCATLVGCGMEQVDEGYRGIYTFNGAMRGEPLEPGLHFYNPFLADVLEISVMEDKWESKTEAFTADTQTVFVDFTVTYYPDPKRIGQLWAKFGREWPNKTVGQVVLGAMKDSIGKYKAGDLVGKREEAAKAAQANIQEALQERGINISRLDFTNLNFKDEYEKAIQDKLTAIENANAEKNKTVQIEEQARQTVATAKAQAEAMRIQTEALSRGKELVQYEAVKKWDGQLPQIILGNGSMPILDLKNLGKAGE